MADHSHQIEAESTAPPFKDFDHAHSVNELKNDAPTAGVGELSFEEYTSGGLGRHLGVWSTIFLM